MLVSFPIWGIWQDKESYSLAKLYSNTSLCNVSISQYQNYQMYPMKDDIAMHYLNPMKVTLSTNTTVNNQYTLVLRLSKHSTMNPDILKISINSQIYLLSSLYQKQDDNYSYYLIDQGTLTDIKIYNINIWMDYDLSGNEDLNTTLTYDIINLDSIES